MESMFALVLGYVLGLCVAVWRLRKHYAAQLDRAYQDGIDYAVNVVTG